MKTKNIPLCVLLSAAFLIVAALPSKAQENQVFTLTADSLKDNKSVELDKLQWKYHAGDDAAWASPQLDDSSWEVLNDTALAPDKLPQSGWRGQGWFRLRLRVDPTLAREPLSLVMQHWGASEIYLDGRLVHRFSTVGATAEAERAFNPNDMPVAIVFDEAGEHTIALRRSCIALRDMNSVWARWLAGLSTSGTGYGAGFKADVKRINDAIEQHESVLTMAGIGLGTVCLAFAVGLIHLLLFLFYPTQRANLFFSLFALAVALDSFIGYLAAVSHFDIAAYGFMNVVFASSVVTLNTSFLAFLYTAFYPRIPKYLWVYLAVITLTFLGQLGIVPLPDRTKPLFFFLTIGILNQMCKMIA